MKNVPEYVKVPKSEYRTLRKELESVCNLYGFEFYEVWNLMIGNIEARHERVIKGKAKSEIRLDMAVSAMADQVRKEYKRREDEKNQDRATKTVAMMKAVSG